MANNTLIFALGCVIGVAIGSLPIVLLVLGAIYIIAFLFSPLIKSPGFLDNRIRWSASLLGAGIFLGNARIIWFTNHVNNLPTWIEKSGIIDGETNVEMIFTARTRFPFEYKGYGTYTIPIDLHELNLLPTHEGRIPVPVYAEDLPKTKNLSVILHLQNARKSPRLIYTLRKRYGITIQGTARYRPRRTLGNPGSYDFNSIYITRGCSDVIQAKAEDITIIDVGSWWYPAAIAGRVRSKLRVSLHAVMSKPIAAIATGVGLGDSAGLRKQEQWGTEIQETFRRAGISHILAVSGLHVGIFALTCMQLGRLCKLKLPYTCPAIIFLIMGFVLMVGAKPPSIRAGIMASTMLFINAYIEKRPPFAVGIGLGLSAIWFLLTNPILLFHPSFQLSYGAVLSLLFIAPRIDRLLETGGTKQLVKVTIFWGLSCTVGSIWPDYFDLRVIVLCCIVFGYCFLRQSQEAFDTRKSYGIPRHIRMLLSAQIAIQIGIIIPLSAYYFGYYSVAGNLVNLVVIPLAAFLVPSIMIAAITSSVFVGSMSFFALPFAWWATFLIGVCYASAYFGAQFFPYPMIPRPASSTLMMYYAMVLAWNFAPQCHRLYRILFPAMYSHRLLKEWLVIVSVLMLSWVSVGENLEGFWVVFVRAGREFQKKSPRRA